MILDEIYENIRETRKYKWVCPFAGYPSCAKCRFLFPEIVSYYITNHDGSKAQDVCPCHILGERYVKSEMRRLFP